ncbi:phosphoribosylglycinamide formyltransferase [Pleionea sp. CnH1-48]|uniref:phosphoribosylglycinamide formyltransferase n=1 Tax=Pleionea sp. CnH1-48 TaxID=2954494 RepID=UPI002097E7BC|nr:phosphoribosylglycinamide formyltransferase [Pleionea sp. CnH1-48]MCO7222906.1 phosphoribosylglycinamide formyltransferase [Pleionea sp. CnH1-48]
MTTTLCRTVVLISGSGTNLQALIDGAARQELPIDLVGVISNRPGVAGIERAQKADIPAEVIDHTQFESREAFDEVLREAIQAYAPDLVVLAGYMRIMTPALVGAFAGKMLNIHPSLLPKYPGLHTHRRALENQDTHHGSSVHLVTEELDGGPVIAQSVIKIDADDTEVTLADKTKKAEHTLYPEVVKWFANGQLSFVQGTVILDGRSLASPIQLTEDIDIA